MQTLKQDPNRSVYVKRLAKRLGELEAPYSGVVFRFVKPKYTKTKEIFAGKGPLFADGRWLLAGKKRATYTSFLPETALAEAFASSRYYSLPVASSAPLVFVSAEVKLKRVIDLTDGQVRKRLRLSEDTILKTDWRADNLAGEESVTQAWGWAMHEVGVEAFLVFSAATPGGKNLIVFSEHLMPSSVFKITKEVEWPR